MLLHISDDAFVIHVLAKVASEDGLFVLVLLLLHVLDVAALGLEFPQVLGMGVVDIVLDWLENYSAYF